MYTFVVLSALVAVCAGQVVFETPEVAAARAAHYVAVAEARARTLGTTILPAPIAPGFPATPVFAPAPVGPIFNDGKYRHDFSGEYLHPLPPPAHLPYPHLPLAPVPAPAVPLYDDGQYHKDLVTGHLVHRLVPAPQ